MGTVVGCTYIGACALLWLTSHVLPVIGRRWETHIRRRNAELLAMHDAQVAADLEQHRRAEVRSNR